MRPPSCRRGFTLLEIMVALGLLGILTAAFSQTVLSSIRSFGNVAVVSDLENDTNELLSRIPDEIRQSSLSAPDWTLTSHSITYNLCTGSAAGTKSWGSATTIAVQPEPGEADDGMDNNGNGLADEQQLVVLDDLGAVQQVWGRSIRSGGLTFSRSGNDITISLTLERLNQDGLPVSVTASTLVSLRN